MIRPNSRPSFLRLEPTYLKHVLYLKIPNFEFLNTIYMDFCAKNQIILPVCISISSCFVVTRVCGPMRMSHTVYATRKIFLFYMHCGTQ